MRVEGFRNREMDPVRDARTTRAESEDETATLLVSVTIRLVDGLRCGVQVTIKAPPAAKHASMLGRQ